MRRTDCSNRRTWQAIQFQARRLNWQGALDLGIQRLYDDCRPSCLRFRCPSRALAASHLKQFLRLRLLLHGFFFPASHDLL